MKKSLSLTGYESQTENTELNLLGKKGKRGKPSLRVEPSNAMIRFNHSIPIYDGTEKQSDLIVDESLLSINGLLSPMGVMYPCQHGNHEKMTQCLGFQSKYELENAGYVMLSRCKWWIEPQFVSRPPTREQWKYIEAWWMSNGMDRKAFFDLKDRAE